MPESPFVIQQLAPDHWLAGNESMAVTVSSEVPSFMRRRRGARMTPHGGGLCEMLYVQLLDGTRVYVRQLENGHVDVHVTRREIYP